MTPEEARALEPGTTPGPWTASECTGFIAAAEGERPVLTAGRGDWWCEEDHRLATAAPEMRATIASQAWEWGVEDAYGDTAWMVCDHYEGTQDSETEAREYLSTFGPGSIARLVRRLVGPVEVVEDDWP